MSEPGKKAIVVQSGARHMYAVPAALAKVGMLEALYTDFAVSQVASHFAPMIYGAFPRLRSPLERRVLPSSIFDKTRLFPSWALGITRATRIADPEGRVETLRREQVRAGRKMLRQGFGGATHVVSMFGEGMDYLVAAKERGLIVCVDVVVALSTESILKRAEEKHKGWGKTTFFGGVRGGTSGNDKEGLADLILRVADRMLCPSAFVADDLIENHGVNAEKIRILPYSVSDFWLSTKSETVPGRILFAGSPDLRKGIHVLADVARILKSHAPGYEVVVAGNADESIRNRPECAHLTFLGSVPRSRLQVEFSRADVFCFPSLAEGSAGVTYEALASGVPLVTTHAAGSVVEPGINGLLVPSGDSEATAEAVMRIVEDRGLRANMSKSARARAAQYSLENYQGRLVDAVFGN